MLFDDRLATVLRANTGGDRAARTQFRQLLDLLGSTTAQDAGLSLDRYRNLADQAEQLPEDERRRILNGSGETSRNPTLQSFHAYRRLEQLEQQISDEERAHILREAGLRLRNRRLVALLADGDTKSAASAVATARLSEEDWLTLIPQLPVIARGFLRHRRDLPESAKHLLTQMGVGDLVLPPPNNAAEQADTTSPDIIPVAAPLTPPPPSGPSGLRDKEAVGALLRRIEAFREGKRDGIPSARLPLGDALEDVGDRQLASFEFTSDPDGRINWADAAGVSIAPMVVGILLASTSADAIASLDARGILAMRQHQPLKGVGLVVDAATVISGAWQVDAVPTFDQRSGSFSGYTGRVRRPAVVAVAAVSSTEPSIIAGDSPSDAMRQVLHELRTPVNAIQGFAEIIQQQLFGPAPHEYRALAAGIAVDSAKLLAGFDEVDRLTRLESQTIALDEGEGDLQLALNDTIRRLEGVMRPRNAGFNLSASGEVFITQLAREELLATVWRVLASLAGAMAPSEHTELMLSSDGNTIKLNCQLPASLAALDNKFVGPAPENRPALSAGMFGTGFAFRLARAEIASAGGSFAFEEDYLKLSLPRLTAINPTHSNGERDENAA